MKITILFTMAFLIPGCSSVSRSDPPPAYFDVIIINDGDSAVAVNQLRDDDTLSKSHVLGPRDRITYKGMIYSLSEHPRISLTNEHDKTTFNVVLNHVQSKDVSGRYWTYSPIFVSRSGVHQRTESVD